MTEQLAIKNEYLSLFSMALDEVQKLFPDMLQKKLQDDTLPFEGSEKYTQVFLEMKEPRALFFLGRSFQHILMERKLDAFNVPG